MKKYKFRGEPLKKNTLYSRNNLESLNFHSQMKIKTFVTVKTITIGETLAHMQVLCFCSMKMKFISVYKFKSVLLT